MIPLAVTVGYLLVGVFFYKVFLNTIVNTYKYESPTWADVLMAAGLALIWPGSIFGWLLIRVEEADYKNSKIPNFLLTKKIREKESGNG